MPALAMKMESETSVEERVARLEVNVEHIQFDISEMKDDIRRLDTKIDAVDQRLSAKIDSVKDSVMALNMSMEQSFAALRIGRMMDKVWWLLIAAAILSVMARGFQWI